MKLLKNLMRYLKDEGGFLQYALPAIAASSAIAGAFGKRKTPAPVDVNPLLNTIRQGAERQRRVSGSIRPSLQPFTQSFQAGTNQAVQGAQEASRNASTKYLQDIGRTFDNTGDQFANTLSQRTLEQQPALNQQARETLAASGGLNRGAASRALLDVNRNLATDLSRGQTDLALGQAQAKNEAMRGAIDKINTLDNTTIQNKLGIDRDTLATVFQTGRQDLIDEATRLLGINQGETEQNVDVRKFGINQDLARNVSKAQGSNSLFDTLLQGGLQGLSTYAASRGK